MLKARALALDLDGTLADTAPDLVAAAGRVATTLGARAPDADAVRACVSAGARAMMAAALATEPEDPLVAFAAKRLEKAYAADPARLTRLFPGVRALLTDLYARGVPWCVVTNKADALARLVMHGLAPLPPGYAGLVAAGMTRHAKPHGQPLRLAAMLSGVAPGAIVFAGDDRRDIQCAHAVGARSVAVTWGYIARGDDPHDWGADRVVDDAPALATEFLCPR